jgi:hypothetical protein
MIACSISFVFLCDDRTLHVHDFAADEAPQAKARTSQRVVMPNIRSMRDLSNASVEAEAERCAAEQGLTAAQTEQLKAKSLTDAFAEAKQRKEEDASRKKLLKTKAKPEAKRRKRQGLAHLYKLCCMSSL